MAATAEKRSRGRALDSIIAVIEEFRKLDPTISTQAVMTFVYIARNEGCSTVDVGEALGLSQAAASRNVGVFLKEHLRHGTVTEGYDMLKQAIDPHNRRRRIITLTPRGRRIADSIVTAVGG